MPAVPTLRAMGWGITPVYVGQQAGGGLARTPSPPLKGASDALNASMRARVTCL
jgi:hypothetical protein